MAHRRFVEIRVPLGPETMLRLEVDGPLGQAEYVRLIALVAVIPREDTEAAGQRAEQEGGD